MRRNVLIAGAGQLGSRYLQGLSGVLEPLSIWVFDVSRISLVRAEQRWREVGSEAAHEVRYLSSLSTLPIEMNLAIISTTADVRSAVVAEIAQKINISDWILEKVLTQSIEEIDILQRTLAHKSAWVNTPMHLWPLYSELRKLYPSGTQIKASFEGFGGLACNAIHYIDFVSRWNGAPVILVDTSGLQPEWYAARRNGFYEIDGNISISFADGSILKLASDRKNLGYKVNIKIARDEWQVFEADGVARASNGRILYGGIIFQSQLTAPLAKAIFSGSLCGLPTLAESSQQHTFLLSALLDHWNRFMPKKVNRLPIT